VSPHLPDNPILKQEAKQFVSKYGGEGSGVVDKDDIGTAVLVQSIVLDTGEKGVNGIMGITTRAHTHLVVCQGVMSFEKGGQSSDKNTLI